MLSTVLMTVALAAAVGASPRHQALHTVFQTQVHVQTDIETVYKTVTGTAPTPTIDDVQKDVDSGNDGNDNGNMVIETSVVTLTAGGDQGSSGFRNRKGTNPQQSQQQEQPAASTYATSTKAQTTAEAAQPSSGSSGDGGSTVSQYEDEAYVKTVVTSHNIHRANHSANAVGWSDDLWNSAKMVAESCKYGHNVTAGGGGYGQNIAAGVSKDNVSAVITDMFYNGEEPLYSYYGQEPDMSNFEAWGHFTQIVWKDTSEVACFTADCSSTGLQNTGGGVAAYFTVCNYKGPGNYGGEYAANVLAPKGDPTASWSTGNAY